MIITGAGDAIRQRATDRRLESIGKAWSPNDIAIIGFPIFKNERTGKLDIITANGYGNRINDKDVGMKRFFIPTNSELDHETGKPLHKTVLDRASRLSRMILDGQYALEVAETKESTDDETILATTLEKLKKKYKGEDGKGKNAIRPAIGGLTYLSTTEVAYFPLVKDAVNMEKAGMYSMELSNDKAEKLVGILNDKQNEYEQNLNEDGIGYAEIRFVFGSDSDKKKAGKKTEMYGIVQSFALKTMPEWKDIEGVLDRLPKDSEVIKKRNYSFEPKSEGEINQVLAMWAPKMAKYVNTYISDSQVTKEDKEKTLKSNAEIIKSLMIKIKDEEAKTLIDEEVKKLTGEKEELTTEEIANAEQANDADDLTGDAYQAPTDGVGGLPV